MRLDCGCTVHKGHCHIMEERWAWEGRTSALKQTLIPFPCMVRRFIWRCSRCIRHLKLLTRQKRLGKDVTILLTFCLVFSDLQTKRQGIGSLSSAESWCETRLTISPPSLDLLRTSWTISSFPSLSFSLSHCTPFFRQPGMWLATLARPWSPAI